MILQKLDEPGLIRKKRRVQVLNISQHNYFLLSCKKKKCLKFRKVIGAKKIQGRTVI